MSSSPVKDPATLEHPPKRKRFMRFSFTARKDAPTTAFAPAPPPPPPIASPSSETQVDNPPSPSHFPPHPSCAISDDLAFIASSVLHSPLSVNNPSTSSDSSKVHSSAVKRHSGQPKDRAVHVKGGGANKVKAHPSTAQTQSNPASPPSLNPSPPSAPSVKPSKKKSSKRHHAPPPPPPPRPTDWSPHPNDPWASPIQPVGHSDNQTSRDADAAPDLPFPPCTFIAFPSSSSPSSSASASNPPTHPNDDFSSLLSDIIKNSKDSKDSKNSNPSKPPPSSLSRKRRPPPSSPSSASSSSSVWADGDVKPCNSWLTESFCQKGDHCPFSHDLPAGACQNGPPCHFFLNRGRCAKGDDCQYSHEVTLNPTGPVPGSIKSLCKYHPAGRCAKGRWCEFSHDLRLQGCRFHLWGQCKMGDSCRFSHDPAKLAHLQAVMAEEEAKSLGLSPPPPPSHPIPDPASVPILYPAFPVPQPAEFDYAPILRQPLQEKDVLDDPNRPSSHPLSSSKA